MRQELYIDIFADIVCPWCYIGKKRLENALNQRPDIDAIVNWRGFLLNPSIPNGGIDRKKYLHTKFGHAAQSVYSRIAQAGAKSGINFNFDAIKRTPDSRSVHELIISAGSDGDALSELFYQSYFIYGNDISDKDIQLNILKKLDLAHIADESRLLSARKTLEADLSQANQFSVDGVPFFVFNNQLSLAGAHPENILLSTIDAAISA